MLAQSRGGYNSTYYCCTELRLSLNISMVCTFFFSEKEGRKLIAYNTIGRMSGMMVSGRNFSVTKYVMADDIDDTQDPRYHMRRRTIF